MSSEFTVKWLIDFWNNENGLYTVDEKIEASDIDELIDKLDNEIENFTPEENIPNWHDLGDFNVEYVQIKDKKNQIVYQDNDFLDDIKKIEDSKKF